MITVRIKNVEIGSGIPKICVPLVGKNREELFEEIALLENTTYDIVEWRADYYGASVDINGIVSLLSEISVFFKKKPLLFTFRSNGEGGAKSISKTEYLNLYKHVISSGYADIVDIELLIGDDIVKELVYRANNSGVYVLMSNHDFSATPNKETLIKRLCTMQELGADITKIAVMPISARDVSTLISVMVEMEECYADKPFAAISMSALGFATRIIGEAFGSCITFGALKKTSAPGQIAANELGGLLKTIHSALNEQN